MNSHKQKKLKNILKKNNKQNYINKNEQNNKGPKQQKIPILKN